MIKYTVTICMATLALLACNKHDRQAMDVPAEAVSALPVHNVTSISPGRDTMTLFLGTDEGMFYYYGADGHELKRYMLPGAPAKVYWVRQLDVAGTEAFLVSQRDRGVAYVEYATTNTHSLPTLTRYVPFKAGKSSKPVLGTHYSSYVTACAPSDSGTVWISGTSSGLMYISAQDIEAAGRAQTGDTLEARYLQFLKKERDGKVQFRIENIYCHNNSIIATTENGTYIASLSKVNNTDYSDTMVVGLPEAPVLSSCLDGDTLRVLTDGKKRMIYKTCLLRDGNTPHITDARDIRAITHGVTLSAQSEIKVKGNRHTYRLGAADFHSYAILKKGDCFYYINHGTPYRVSLPSLMPPLFAHPSEAVASPDKSHLYVVDASHGLYRVSDSRNVKLLGHITGIDEPISNMVAQGRRLLVAGHKRLYEVDATDYLLAAERRAKEIKLPDIEGMDEIVSMAAASDSILLIGKRLDMLRCNTETGEVSSVKFDWIDRQCLAPYITAIAPVAGTNTALLGSLHKGLIWYDGRRVHPAYANIQDIRHIDWINGKKATVLTGSDIYVYDAERNKCSVALHGLFDHATTAQGGLIVGTSGNLLVRQSAGKTDSAVIAARHALPAALGGEMVYVTSHNVLADSGHFTLNKPIYWIQLFKGVAAVVVCVVILVVIIGLFMRNALLRRLDKLSRQQAILPDTANRLKNSMTSLSSLWPNRLSLIRRRMAEAQQEAAEALARYHKEEMDIKEQDIRQLSSKNSQLSSENSQLSSKNSQLSSKNRQLSSKNSELSSENRQLSSKNSQLSSENSQLSFNTNKTRYECMKTGAQNIAESMEAISSLLPADVKDVLDNLQSLCASEKQDKDYYDNIEESMKDLELSFGRYLDTFSSKIDRLIMHIDQAAFIGNASELKEAKANLAAYLDGIIVFWNAVIDVKVDDKSCMPDNMKGSGARIKSFGCSKPGAQINALSEDKMVWKMIKRLAKKTGKKEENINMTDFDEDPQLSDLNRKRLEINARMFSLILFYRPGNSLALTKQRCADLLIDRDEYNKEDFEFLTFQLDDIKRHTKASRAIILLRNGLSENYSDKAVTVMVGLSGLNKRKRNDNECEKAKAAMNKAREELKDLPPQSYYDLLWNSYISRHLDTLVFVGNK